MDYEQQFRAIRYEILVGSDGKADELFAAALRRAAEQARREALVEVRRMAEEQCCNRRKNKTVYFAACRLCFGHAPDGDEDPKHIDHDEQCPLAIRASTREIDKADSGAL